MRRVENRSPESVGNPSVGNSAHHRWVTDEPDIPFDYTVLFENARVIVIDKPHFLATTPRGMWYRNTALTRLREQLNNPDIVPAHRLDRATAGIILFVKHVNDRGAYQMKFQNREVTKTYECLAPLPGPEHRFPVLYRSRIVKERHVLQAYEIEGAPNSETLIEFVGEYSRERAGESTFGSTPLGLYRLHPKTGKTHQLRVHMNALGLPIAGDDLYPNVIDRAYDDFSSPLQLVATRFEMTDPLNGDEWDFRSQFAYPRR